LTTFLLNQSRIRRKGAIEDNLYCGGRKTLTMLSLELRARGATSADVSAVAKLGTWEGESKDVKRSRMLHLLRKAS
jgi:hypothetical protein